LRSKPVVNPAVAPYVPNYASAAPYITAAEYKASANAVNTNAMLPGASAGAVLDALTDMCINASAWADALCNQTLAATVEVASGWYRIDRDGYVNIPVDMMPVIQVNSFVIGTPGIAQAATDLSGVIFDDNILRVPVATYSLYPNPGQITSNLSGKVYCVLTYVAGFANTALTVGSAAGDRTQSVAGTVGLFPGLQVRINDPGQSENITILSVAGSVVTYATPLVQAHAAVTNVSALPGNIKLAAILLVTALAKGRSFQSVTMSSMSGTSSSKVQRTVDGTEDVERAVSLLTPHTRVA
jgi:hypothetical protein